MTAIAIEDFDVLIKDKEYEVLWHDEGAIRVKISEIEDGSYSIKRFNIKEEPHVGLKEDSKENNDCACCGNGHCAINTEVCIPSPC